MCVYARTHVCVFVCVCMHVCARVRAFVRECMCTLLCTHFHHSNQRGCLSSVTFQHFSQNSVDTDRFENDIVLLRKWSLLANFVADTMIPRSQLTAELRRTDQRLQSTHDVPKNIRIIIMQHTRASHRRPQSQAASLPLCLPHKPLQVHPIDSMDGHVPNLKNVRTRDVVVHDYVEFVLGPCWTHAVLHVNFLTAHVTL